MSVTQGPVWTAELKRTIAEAGNDAHNTQCLDKGGTSSHLGLGC